MTCIDDSSAEDDRTGLGGGSAQSGHRALAQRYRAEAIATTPRTARIRLVRSATARRRWVATICAVNSGEAPASVTCRPRLTSRPIVGRVTSAAMGITETARSAPTVSVVPNHRTDPVAE